MAVGNTYTPQTGLTPQGTQVDNLTQLLTQFQNMPPASANVSADQVGAAQANAINYGAGEQGYLQQTQQNLTQQAGIPQLQGQSQDMGKIFQMWLADQNIAQKYASPQLGTPNSPVYSYQPQNASQAPFSGNYQGPPNPYLNSSQDIINAVTQPPGQGFQGFTTPGMNTSAMTQVPNASNNIMNILQGAIGNEQGLVSGKLGQAQTEYDKRLSVLDSIANLFGQERSSQLAAQAAKSSGSGVGSVPYNQNLENNIQKDVRNGMTLEDLILKYRAEVDPNSIYGIYNTIHMSDKSGTKGSKGWGTAKQSAEQLAQMGITGAPVTQAGRAKGKLQKAKLSDGSLGSYDPSTGKYYDGSGNDMSTVEKQRFVTSSQAILDSAKKMKDELNRTPWALRNLPGAKYMFPNLAAANSRLMNNISDLKKAIGGRVTQQELFKWLDSQFPSGKDISPDVMDAKIQVLQDKVNAAIRNEGGNVPQSKSDPMGIL